MSMDKRFVEIFTRLDAIEQALFPVSLLIEAKIEEEIEARIESRLSEMQSDAPQQPTQTAVTKEQLMSIKGVGSSTADEILKLLNS